MLTARPISCSSLNIELLIACFCNHDHLTSIKLSSGARTGRNTNFIFGQHMDISFCTLFDLCAERLSGTRKIFWILLSYLFLLFLENQQTVSLFSFYSIVHASCHLYGHMLQTHLASRLFFEPSQPLPVLMTTKYHHESLLLLALSHLHIKVQNLGVYCP